MGKNIRRGKTSSVRCASCGQLTRRDRSVYLFRDGIKAYYCPDCAKKIHGSRLYKGMPKFIRRAPTPKTKRKFAMYSTQGAAVAEAPAVQEEIITDEHATGSTEEIETEETAPQEEIKENRD